jgi:phage repressor protein C with HTH and peptisase S24 domain
MVCVHVNPNQGAAVISIREGLQKQAKWSLLEVARAGENPVPYGVLLADSATDALFLRCRDAAEFVDLEEQEADILDYLQDDLRNKAAENGASALLNSLEDSLSGFLRISDRAALAFTGNPQRAADRLFDEYVDAEIREYETHLPYYGLRAAATKFGEGMAAEEEQWIRVPGHLRLVPGMFIARVIGKSMEPLIPDDSLCVFRSNVAGSRKGRYLLIEKFGESDFASRYTVKRYTSEKVVSLDEDGEWAHTQIRLEPLNPDFEAFNLGVDGFRVIAEFVAVLD